MDKKVILISIDGMRSDGVLGCNNPYVKELTGVSILDIAPTIAEILGVNKSPEWEGKSLISDN